MRNRLGTLVFLGLGTALFGCSCDGPTACQSAAARISDTCGGDAAFAAFGEADRAGFESACGPGTPDACLSCIDALLTSAAGCANLASCVEECACPPGTICGVGDAGNDAGAPPDSGPVDAPPVGCSPAPAAGSAAGAACRSGTTCTRDACNEELPVGFGSCTGGTVPVTLYPGSMCGNECDPNAMTDPCGECATCTDFGYIGRIRIPVLGPPPPGGMFLTLLDGVCRSNCTPNVATNGGCRSGYTCDIDGQVCLEACTTDADCNLGVEDGFLCPGTGPWTCDTTTRRCVQPGTAGAGAGDACAEDDDCMANGQCFTGDELPDGFCSRLGCNAAGFECGTGETCSLRGLGGPSWCLPACTVGDEPEADRFGTDGHGAGCPTGHACTWDGRTMDPTGGCFPGEYNEITTPNIGGACQTGADCYSPFGYGRCLFDFQTNVDSGMCAVSNCVGMDANGILPGVTTTTRVCDEAAGELCVGFAGGDTFCLLGCDSAAECAPGYACPELLTGGGRLCWPQCFAAGDCRTGATCEQVDPDTGASTGPCDFDGPDNVANSGDEPDCFCSDRMPRAMDDGGTPTPDGGTSVLPDAGIGLDASGILPDAGLGT